MPSKEELEWYISGRGKDGQGVAVFYDDNTGAFMKTPGFQDRVDAWNCRELGHEDPFRLETMPSKALIDALVHNQPGVTFNHRTHEVEFRL